MKIKIILSLCLVFLFTSCEDFIMNNSSYDLDYQPPVVVEPVEPEEPVGPVEPYITLESSNLMVQTKDLSSGCTRETATELCDISVVGGFTDWHLPTKAELIILYENRSLIGGFSSDNYWSSTLSGPYEAWYVSFDTGYQNRASESNQFRVRAVRSL
jgi:hypothetical protein